MRRSRKSWRRSAAVGNRPAVVTSRYSENSGQPSVHGPDPSEYLGQGSCLGVTGFLREIGGFCGSTDPSLVLNFS